MKADISIHHSATRKDNDKMADTWKIGSDLEMTLAELDKLDFLANTIFETASTAEDEKTYSEKVSKALLFYADRKNIAICASLLMDTVDAIRKELANTAAEAYAITEANASGGKAS